MKTSRLIYRSKCKDGLSKEDLKHILTSSHSNNPKRNISGVLCLDDGHFLQLIEGPHEALNELLQKILQDHRHHDVEIIEFSSNKKRRFGKWEMLFMGDDEKTRKILTTCTGKPDIRPWQINREILPDFFKKIARTYSQMTIAS